MALFDIKLFSTSLQTQTDVRVYIPTPENDAGNNAASFYDRSKRFQVLYLLHGATGDCTVWSRYTSIERYARQRNLAVVCASVGNSFYADMVHGGKYLTYMTQELPTFIGRMFPVSEKREDTFIVGNSMGGFGAYRIAMEQPERFCCAVSLSGALDVISMARMYANDPSGGFSAVFAPEDLMPGSDNDLIALAEKRMKEGRMLPKFYQCCGTEDFLYAMNTSFHDRFRKLDVDLVYDESKGIHDWEYWDTQIRKVLEWLPLANTLVEE